MQIALSNFCKVCEETYLKNLQRSLENDSYLKALYNLQMKLV
jgi:hypothetical protein